MDNYVGLSVCEFLIILPPWIQKNPYPFTPALNCLPARQISQLFSHPVHRSLHLANPFSFPASAYTLFFPPASRPSFVVKDMTFQASPPFSFLFSFFFTIFLSYRRGRPRIAVLHISLCNFDLHRSKLSFVSLFQRNVVVRPSRQTGGHSPLKLSIFEDE